MKSLTLAYAKVDYVEILGDDICRIVWEGGSSSMSTQVDKVKELKSGELVGFDNYGKIWREA